MNLSTRKIEQRDHAELDLLARYVSEWTYNLIISYVKSKEDTEEIIQDTLVSTINNISKFKGVASLKSWVYRIAINKSKDHLKFQGRQKRSGNVISIYQNEENGIILEPGFYRHPGIELESKEKIGILYNGINSLPDKQKEALALNKLEHLSIKEVSDIMDLSYKAVESLISRGKKNLRAYLETKGFETFKKRIKS